jgi:hypothetical protein
MFGADYVKRVAVLVHEECIYVCEDCLVKYLEENNFISSHVRRAIDGQNHDMTESAGWGEVRFVTAGSEKLTEILRCNEDEYEDGLYCDLCSNEIFEPQVEEDEDEEEEDEEAEVLAEDGYADGGVAYSQEELDIINK